VSVLEKGGVTHSYSISREGLEAIRAYFESERLQDAEQWPSSQVLFLTAHQNPRGGARLSVRSVNVIWDDVCKTAGVEGKTPHSARHAMGKHIIEETGNIAAVQRQLGHKNVAYSMQYSRITAEELGDVINDR
jgi:site-specific recombinase XerD